jgi:hypothetical protein
MEVRFGDNRGPVTESAFVRVFVVVSVFSQVCVHVKVCVCAMSRLKFFPNIPPLNADSMPKACEKLYEAPFPTVDVFTFTVLYSVVVPPPFPGPDWR